MQLIYETIINYNIIPKSFNIGLVKLLIKNPKKSNSDMNNMRPLTISDCSAIILEKYLLDEINKNLKNTKSNQFGFKAKSSCGHAVFTLKESVLYNRRKKKRTYICAIDARVVKQTTF